MLEDALVPKQEVRSVLGAMRFYDIANANYQSSRQLKVKYKSQMDNGYIKVLNELNQLDPSSSEKDIRLAYTRWFKRFDESIQNWYEGIVIGLGSTPISDCKQLPHVSAFLSYTLTRPLRTGLDSPTS